MFYHAAAQLVRSLVNPQQVTGSIQQQGERPLRTRQPSECVSYIYSKIFQWVILSVKPVWVNHCNIAALLNACETSYATQNVLIALVVMFFFSSLIEIAIYWMITSEKSQIWKTFRVIE